MVLEVWKSRRQMVVDFENEVRRLKSGGCDERYRRTRIASDLDRTVQNNFERDLWRGEEGDH